MRRYRPSVKPHRNRRLSLVALAAAWLAGCSTLPLPAVSIETVESAVEPQQSETVAPAEPGPLSGDHWLPDGSFDASRDALPVGFRELTPAYRWRMARPDVVDLSIDELRKVADADEAGTAAILLAHRGEFDAAALRDVWKDVNRGGRTRAAAIEAWSRANVGTSESEWAVLAPLLKDSDPVVRTEAVRSIGRGVAPQRVPAIADAAAAWSRQSDAMKEAILDACLLYAVGVDRSENAWPRGIEDARFDPSVGVRRRYGRLAALAKSSDAAEVLASQARDIEPAVRHAALESLGLLETEAAITTLREASAGPGEQIRAAAVRGLAAAGVTDVGASDESAVVREAAATALAADSGPAAVATVRQMTGDSDRRVQSAAVAAASHWPDEDALPVLLTALERSTHVVRGAALDEFRRRTKIDEPFAVAASAERRKQIVSRWRTLLAVDVRVATPTTTAVTKDLAWALHATAAGDRSEAVVDVLRTVTVADIPAVESFARESAANAAAVWNSPLGRDVLPGLRDDFAHVEAMRAGGMDRVRAVESLAVYAADRTPSPLACDRLVELMNGQQNARAWRAALAVVSHDAADPRGPLSRLLPAALNCPWPDVRRLACETVATAGDASHAVWLRPLFTDGDAGVRLAAARAAAACGNPVVLRDDGEATGLRSLRTDTSIEVRNAATAAAAALGDDESLAELLRLAHSPDVQVRRFAAASLRDAFAPATAVLPLAWAERDHETLTAYEAALARELGDADGRTSEDRLRSWAARVDGGIIDGAL